MKKIWIYFFIIVSLLLILAGVFRVLSSLTNYQVIAISENTNSELGIKDEIEIIFNKSISADFNKNCQIVFSPELEFTTQVSADRLKIKAKTRFIPGQKYNLKIICRKQEILNLPLQIKTEEKLTPEEIQINQIHLDYEFGQEIMRVWEEQPFRKNLPISTDKYVIAYSQNNDAIMVVLRPGQTQELVEEEVEQAISQAQVPPLMKVVWK
ncbi:MAG: hypothetical protein ABFQ62_01940 [Patescibacteria group bacterium]